MMKRSFALALALAATGFAASPAVASTDQESYSATVRYDDIDLSTAEGLEDLDRRIDQAARKVCELDRTDTGTRIRSREARACYQEAKRSFEQSFAALISEARLGG